MKSLTASRDSQSRGFTLIEVLVSMGLLVIVFAMGSIINVDSYGRELIITEHSMLISTLQKARNLSMNNIYESRHGVHIEEDSFVLFREFPYKSANNTNEVIPRNSNIAISGMDEIVFEQLSGAPNSTGKFTLSDGMRNRVVEIFESGLIDW